MVNHPAKKIIVLGALSEIAEATCRLYAKEGAELVITGRDQARLNTVADDLRVRGASKIVAETVDLTENDPQLLTKWVDELGGVDVVLLAYGALGEQPALEQDLEAAGKLIDTNFRSAALWVLTAANELEKRKAGSLVVLGSVAGDRGRQSNYVYGATKAGLGVLVEGVAHRLAKSGARAVLIKPGFVDTAMTAHIPNKGALWSSPQKIAAIIKKAADGSKPVIYAPGYWRLIMSVIKSVPSGIFHRTKL